MFSSCWHAGRLERVLSTQTRGSNTMNCAHWRLPYESLLARLVNIIRLCKYIKFYTSVVSCDVLITVCQARPHKGQSQSEARLRWACRIEVSGLVCACGVPLFSDTCTHPNTWKPPTRCSSWPEWGITTFVWTAAEVIASPPNRYAAPVPELQKLLRRSQAKPL